MLADLTAGSVADAELRAETLPLAEVERAALAQSAPRDARTALAPAAQVKLRAAV